MFDDMYCGDECYHGFSCSYISLKESSHGMGLFHVFEYLKEDDFLFIRQRKGERRNDFFYKFRIERNLWCESFAGISCCIFLLDTDHLKLEEFTISEFFLCSLE